MHVVTCPACKQADTLMLRVEKTRVWKIVAESGAIKPTTRLVDASGGDERKSTTYCTNPACDFIRDGHLSPRETLVAIPGDK